MAADSSSIVSFAIKYIILGVVSYFVTYSVTQNRLDKNQMLLISFAITVIFALIDLYSGLFTGMMSALCKCPPLSS